MTGWTDRMNEDPTSWLLEADQPAVRHLAMLRLLDRPPEDPEVAAAQSEAMRADPIASILDAQNPAGYWVQPGRGYGPKYTGTVWNVIFLDQLGAGGNDPRIRAACEYVLEHTQTPGGGFSATAQGKLGAAPSGVIHCLNGNLLRAMIGLGRLDDERVQRALAWQAASITGEGMGRWYALTPGPGFACGVNSGNPCAWGAVKAVLALARVPEQRRCPEVERALSAGTAFLLGRDPAVADYPMPRGNTRPNGSWFKIGFPSGYVADVLQTLEALCEAGAAGDTRLDHAVDWLLAQQDAKGRWANRNAYAGKMVRDIDRAGQPSKWVTLRACVVLNAVARARA